MSVLYTVLYTVTVFTVRFIYYESFFYRGGKVI